MSKAAESTVKEAEDPEIPDKLKSRLSKPHRPPGYTPKAGDDDDGTPAQKVVKAKVKNLKPFFDKLNKVLILKSFSEEPQEFEVTVHKTVKGKKKIVKEMRIRNVKVRILHVGEDGLPYPARHITAAEGAEICARQYPGAPKMDPIIGDYSPDFVEWLYLNHPYDAAVRYFARHTHVQAYALA